MGAVARRVTVKACTRCRRVLPLDAFRRSATGYPSRLCTDCGRTRRVRGSGAARPAPTATTDDDLQPRERARHEMRVLAAGLVATQLD